MVGLQKKWQELTNCCQAGLVVYETHCIIYLAQELFCHPNETLKMMSQETYDFICTRDYDLAKLEADEKDLSTENS
ncbi:hypothetical protein OC709_02260 ['Planchonia careya' phytoplasma]|nr:hypothetical protein ['Planchonia careya' phytoplasma]MDO8030322.1 hypothetical protein ['Planchonia careya' phytoplasma]